MVTLLESPASGPARVPESGASGLGFLAGRALTVLIIIGPAIGIAIAVPLLWGHLLGLRDICLGVAFYVVSGFGISVGYHRLFAHGSFRAPRWLE